MQFGFTFRRFEPAPQFSKLHNLNTHTHTRARTLTASNIELRTSIKGHFFHVKTKRKRINKNRKQR